MPNYKSGGSWVAIPDAALWSTYRGTYQFQYPQATEMTASGLPCGAFGKPVIQIYAPLMSDSGMDFWRDLFGSTTAQYVSVSIEARDARTGTAGKFAGYLKWPTYSGVSWGSTDAKTMYRDVRIEIVECVTTT